LVVLCIRIELRLRAARRFDSAAHATDENLQSGSRFAAFGVRHRIVRCRNPRDKRSGIVREWTDQIVQVQRRGRETIEPAPGGDAASSIRRDAR